jgi:hypothetical protein
MICPRNFLWTADSDIIVSLHLVTPFISMVLAKHWDPYWEPPGRLNNSEKWSEPGSTKANGREPKSCLGQVFNFKLDCFVTYAIERHIQAHPSLELNTLPWFRPVSWSLSMSEHSSNPYNAECRYAKCSFCWMSYCRVLLCWVSWSHLNCKNWLPVM